MSDDSTARGTDAPRTLSYENFSFNFKVGLGARVAARFGAPAFAQRRAKLNRNLASFWTKVEERYAELWTAALEGRIGHDDREVRQSLMQADGTDPLHAREHRRQLQKEGAVLEETARADFNRAWDRFLDRCGMAELELEVRDFVKYFPVESGMRMDPETDRYMWMGEPWEPPVAPTRDVVLERFPMR